MKISKPSVFKLLQKFFANDVEQGGLCEDRANNFLIKLLVNQEVTVEIENLLFKGDVAKTGSSRR